MGLYGRVLVKVNGNIDGCLPNQPLGPTCMKIQSIDIEVELNNDDLGDLNRSIESNLQKWGEPLRWAITTIDPVTKLARVEAIVIVE